MKPSATAVETMYGVEHTYSATRTTATRSRVGTTYEVAVDGKVVAKARYLGGRRYLVTNVDGSAAGAWEFVTQSDGGKVSDVMEYVARCSISEAHDG